MVMIMALVPKFLPLMLLTAWYLSLSAEASHTFYEELQSVSAVEVKQLHRPAYHFLPRRNWMNDPNGPMYFKGLYHLFYQYNPKGSVWGQIVWGHSVSVDLINWKELEPALAPSKAFDKYGCWSGSATVVPGRGPVILYTGVVDSYQGEVQNYAVPANIHDPYLRKWVRPDNNPLIYPDSTINATQFRDPTTAWLGKDGHWRILVGGRRGHRGMAFLYRSKDFLHWVKAKHPLHSAPNTGNWECPDFYPVPMHGKNGLDASVMGGKVKHVLKNSLDTTRYDYYTIGTYYPDKDRYVPDNSSVDGWDGLRYDYGNLYASKSFYDPKKSRRIIWGWTNESDTTLDDVAKGWAGIQTIPRSVWLDPSGKQVVQSPIEEIKTLRRNRVEMKDKILKEGEHIEVKGISAAQADVEVSFSFSSLEKAEPFNSNWKNPQDLCALKGSNVKGGLGPFGLMTLASENHEEFTPVFFRVFKAPTRHIILMCSDARSSSLKDNLYKPPFAGFVDVDLTKDSKLSLRSLIDHSVVESFGAGGKTCITSRVYPTLAVLNKAHLHVFNNGTQDVEIAKLEAWTMKSPKGN